jgi:hypothetical protein
MKRWMALLFLLFATASCRAPGRDATSEVSVTASPRKGIEPRASFLATAPKNGLLLTSNGLVNETFRIAADFDAGTISRETTYAKDGSKETHSRALTEPEIVSLREDRDRVWSVWIAPSRNPAAEYREDLFLLDGDQTTAITAQGGFQATHSGDTPDAIALARRLDEMTHAH